MLFKRLVDITTLKVGQYMQPLDESFPAIDAFCVSAGVPWEPEAGREPVLLLLQMTVARPKRPKRRSDRSWGWVGGNTGLPVERGLESKSSSDGDDD